MATDPNDFIPCPRSEHLAQGTINWTTHYAPRIEIEAHRGMCAACFEWVRRHHSLVQHGQTELPAEMTVHHASHDAERDHIYVGPDGAEQAVDFDWSEIDGAVDELAASPADAQDAAAELVRKIFVALVGDKITPATMRGATARFALLCAAIAPDALPLNQVALGRLFGLTKANFSKHAITLQQRLGIRFSTSRSPAARENMRNAQLAKPGARNTRPRPHPSKDSFENTQSSR